MLRTQAMGQLKKLLLGGSKGESLRSGKNHRHPIRPAGKIVLVATEGLPEPALEAIALDGLWGGLAANRASKTPFHLRVGEGVESEPFGAKKGSSMQNQLDAAPAGKWP